MLTKLSLTFKNFVGQQGCTFCHRIILSPFWVTSHHRSRHSRDYKTRSGWFPMWAIDTNPLSRIVTEILCVIRYLSIFPL